jgi:hypothetical protein
MCLDFQIVQDYWISNKIKQNLSPPREVDPLTHSNKWD